MISLPPTYFHWFLFSYVKNANCLFKGYSKKKKKGTKKRTSKNSFESLPARPSVVSVARKVYVDAGRGSGVQLVVQRRGVQREAPQQRRSFHLHRFRLSRATCQVTGCSSLFSSLACPKSACLCTGAGRCRRERPMQYFRGAGTCAQRPWGGISHPVPPRSHCLSRFRGVPVVTVAPSLLGFL